MNDPKDILPLVDSGSDTFARFRYQAEVALPYCLHCALSDDIISVVMEHLEDIAIEYVDKWRFIQVKSRNNELGPWKLNDLVKPGGALYSLHRTERQIHRAVASLEIVLEGAIRPRDPIQFLKDDGDHSNLKLISTVARKMDVDQAETQEFLRRVVLVKPPISRDGIKESNIALMHDQNPQLSRIQVVPLYENLISEIERAMRADPLGLSWPSYVLHPEDAPSEVSAKLNAKRLTRDHLRRIIGPLMSPPRPLLMRLTDATSASISALERKLAEGGATAEIIYAARNLRANAEMHMLQLQTSDLFPRDIAIDDLNQRLLTYAVTKHPLYSGSPKPANGIWNDLLVELTANPSNIDRNNLMSSDPMLLLGQICELSNNCLVDWGIANAQ